jgi:hypothetical protein
MKRRPYNPQFAAPIKSRRDRLDEAVERDNQVAARRTREYEAAQARETLSAAEGKIACAVPPAGWHCTRNAGHSGPCAAHPAAPEAPASAPAAPQAQAEPSYELASALNSLRWMLNKSDECDKPNMRATTLLDKHHSQYGKTIRQDLEYLWRYFDPNRPEMTAALFAGPAVPVPQEAEQAAPAAVTALSDADVVAVLASLGIDAEPSKYGFDTLQVHTTVPAIRDIVGAYLKFQPAAPAVTEAEQARYTRIQEVDDQEAVQDWMAYCTILRQSGETPTDAHGDAFDFAWNAARSRTFAQEAEQASASSAGEQMVPVSALRQALAELGDHGRPNVKRELRAILRAAESSTPATTKG